MTRRHVLVVSSDDARVRLDDFLAAHFGTLSRMKIRQAVDAGLCRVNDSPAPGHRLAAGDEIAVELDPAAPNAMQPEEIPLRILFEDDRLAVVDKPAGMLVHPTRGVKSGTLANALAWHWNRNAAAEDIVRPVFLNRLDKPTSGLVVVAKTEPFRVSIEKRYVAVLAGAVERDREIRAPIARVSEQRPHWQVSEHGKPALSLLVVLERNAHRTLAELEPVTGRTDQLRIHCAHVGHPIVGDTEYGGPEAARLCLHATWIGFRHPDTAVRVEVKSEMPAQMRQIYSAAVGS